MVIEMSLNQQERNGVDIIICGFGLMLLIYNWDNISQGYKDFIPVFFIIVGIIWLIVGIVKRQKEQELKSKNIEK